MGNSHGIWNDDAIFSILIARGTRRRRCRHVFAETEKRIAIRTIGGNDMSQPCAFVPV